MTFAVVLTELALDKRITWTQAEALLNAHEADLASQDALSDLLSGESTVDTSAARPPATERDVAFVLMIRDVCQDFAPLTSEDRFIRQLWVDAWDGASPAEAFAFDLRIWGKAMGTCVNPGDGSGIPGMSIERLRSELELLATWPRPSRWTHDRTRLVVDEVKDREQIRG